MTDPIDDLEVKLTDAAQRRLAARVRRHRWRWGAGIVVALGVSVPAAASVDGLWRPDIGPQPPPPTVTVSASSAVPCDVEEGSASRPSTGQPSAALLSALGVLRTPQTANDRPPDPKVLARLDGAQLGATRYVGTVNGGRRYYVVPIRNARGIEDPLPERCLRALSDEQRRSAEHRNAAIAKARGGHPRWDICLIEENGGGGCGVGGAKDLLERGTIGTSGAGSGRSHVVGLVPDGVASVTVGYGDGSQRTIDVTRNFFAYDVGLAPPQGLPTIRWNDAAGKTIKTIKR